MERPAKLSPSNQHSDFELVLYPLKSEFVGFIDLSSLNQSSNISFQKSAVPLVVILDQSGSMGNLVTKFVSEILPKVFDLLNYEPNDEVQLITFHSTSESYSRKVKDFPNIGIRCTGCTYMNGAVGNLETFIKKNSQEFDALRLLTISDGDIGDQKETQAAAAKLASSIPQNLQINSQAIRLFTSSAQPDTRAISSLLQLNNSTTIQLVDLISTMSVDQIASAISDLFDDNFSNIIHTIASSEKIFKLNPWTDDKVQSVKVKCCQNSILLSHTPKLPILLNGCEVKLRFSDGLTLKLFGSICRSNIDRAIGRLAILKVLDTDDAKIEVSKILKYYESVTKSLKDPETFSTNLSDTSLKARFNYLKNIIDRRDRSFYQRMSEIANVDKVSNLNSAQQADYLRAASSSKNSRGLAKRAASKGLNFDEIARQEARNMFDHIEELSDINDKNHFVSFYSRETTFGGILAICQLVKENIIDEMSANDILQLINIVGIACKGPIGDFPDPMTWRVNNLYLGCYLSISDILAAHLQSCGECLLTPGTSYEITNVIPVFEDDRIAKFLKSYAPSLLQYSASIGMRRMIADVEMTCAYTVCAGIWKLVEDVNNEPRTSLQAETFKILVKVYDFFIGNYFGHIMRQIKPQEENISFYICNNGVTNMISPLIKIFQDQITDQLQQIPRILRSLYTFEIWQAIRRQYKNRVDSRLIVEGLLNELLGTDLMCHKMPLQPLFVKEPEVKAGDFYGDLNLNEDLLNRLQMSIYYVDYIALLPKLLSWAVNSNSLLTSAIDVPSLNDENIKESLGIDYDLKLFKFYNIFQALYYTTKSSRVDDENEKMLIPDLSDEKEAKRLVQECIRKRYQSQYATDLSAKRKQEKDQLSVELVNSILSSEDFDLILKMFREGLQRGDVNVSIKNPHSLGFVSLMNGLLDSTKIVPLRLDLSMIFLLGREYYNNDEVVWNNGNFLMSEKFCLFENLFKENGWIDNWDVIMKEYHKRGVHLYRELINRHGHGNNKPSYWAFGFLSLEKFKGSVSTEQFEDYCKIHHDCCGVSEFLDLSIINESFDTINVS